MNKRSNRILLSTPGCIMLERGDGDELVRRYASSLVADRMRRQGWRVYVPAAGRGWKRETGDER